ncbi:hypothetical protein [Actinospongicola halichondriae]|uniref:hypothetical protein n=1 Tax=Actinospongicola halichondriae TaxID=3236844 RepID=UPI003D534E29
MSGTTIGNLGSRLDALVDSAGVVRPGHASWSVDWSVGAEDRWHDPTESANVRQVLLGDAPVVETRMRVPGGDIIHRSYAMVATAADGGGDLAIIEVENDSAVPVAISFGVRSGGAVVAADDSTVLVDENAALLLPRPPNEVTADDPGRVTCTFPLPHSATIRVAVPLSLPPRRPGLFRRSRTAPAQVFPAAVPTHEQVVSGWRSQTDRGMRLVLPDERLQSAVDATRRYLLLRHSAVDVDFTAVAFRLAALDRFGFHREVGEAFLPFADDQPKHGSLFARDAEGNAAALWVLAHHWDLTRNDDLLRHLSPAIAGAAELVARRGGGDPWSLAGLRGAPRLLRAAGEDAAADHADRLASPASLDDGVSLPDDALAHVDTMLSDASATWTWGAGEEDDGRSSSARFASLVRAALVRETDEGLALLSSVPRRWFGQGIEVHDAPTRVGTLSFAVRWHGERPALLWELERHDPSAAVTITCAGLDPAWRTTDERGDALLEAPEPPADMATVPGPEQGDSFG